MSDDRRIAAYYDALIDRFGADPRAVDASSQASLDVRYEVLCAVTDLTGKRVLEVGCGFGNLGAFIRERFEGVSYRGVDLSPRMVQEGRRVHPGLDLEVANVLDVEEQYDVVLAQGIFYLLRDEPEARMRELVERMFALAGEAVAFTAISAWAAERAPEEFYVDPGFALELGRSLTKAVVLRHDYHPGDLTLYLYKRGMALSDDGEARRLEALWSGEFGDKYVERNFDDGSDRVPFWRHVLEVIAPRTVLEVGCNVGGNLRALAGLLGPANVAGVDVNESALAALAEAAPEIRTELTPARSLPFADGEFDLVFTTGVLIHQPQDTLPQVIDEIVRCAARFVVCGEYFAERTEEVPYRGHEGALFRGDFGSLYVDRGLELLERGFLPADGVWDDLTYWILAKPEG